MFARLKKVFIILNIDVVCVTNFFSKMKQKWCISTIVYDLVSMSTHCVLQLKMMKKPGMNFALN